MPPRDLTIPTNAVPDLVPDIDTYTDTDSTFGGVPIIPAKQQTQDAFNVLWYAYPGVGKTTLAGMFAGYPPACPVLVVDAEGGASVLSALDNVYVAQVKRWQDVEKILTTLERMPEPTYRTVVFDNLTELHAMLVTSLVGTRPIEIQEHGVITATLMRFTRRVRDLSRFKAINTVLISWEESKEDKLRSITRQVVALTDKLSTRIPGIPNNVGHITVMNNPPLNTRKLSFAVTPTAEGKLRRAMGDDSPAIPLEIYYGLHQNPIRDILRTMYEGVPFPEEQYKLPKGRGKATNVDTNSTTTE
jgi:hypothetical protein